jgi:hypothetical protein
MSELEWQLRELEEIEAMRAMMEWEESEDIFEGLQEEETEEVDM